jgi:arsenate reductase
LVGERAFNVWPGHPITAHWGVEDPAAVSGDDITRRSAFVKAFAVLQKRIALLTSLRLESLGRMVAEQRLRSIGRAP